MQRPPGYGRPSSRAGKKQIVVFLAPDAIGRLRTRARNEERTLQEVLAACLNEGLRPLGHPALFPVEHRRMFVRSSRRAKPRGDDTRPSRRGLNGLAGWFAGGLVDEARSFAIEKGTSVQAIGEEGARRLLSDPTLQIETPGELETA
ncbi:hypothetical protein BHAOGJBA_5136 [Methylobacterium hispanicum]|uniref:CopG family transcriptional regulator n=1 Tax=Methylobacterium hispanicum TaxID=270350 RepID=A0AAV4ZTY1_9HYPH|nr:hypothetical protein [Methylobacterium hispanicum]GJD91588.1 hypothetical protein BHAOGJBA_5136 [Methylobacterium hispanicum]